MPNRDDGFHIERVVAAIILIVWCFIAMMSTVTGNFEALQIASGVALVAAGYLFGYRIIKNGDK